MPRWIMVLLVVFGIVAVVTLAAVVWVFNKSDFFRGADDKFGDQHLKTVVALVELHKVRYGRYPSELADLKFLGDWDPIATTSVSYHANTEGTRYCVEVERGWMRKPHLEMPAEFWQGTGYDPALCK